jgi:hypothetical protein
VEVFLHRSVQRVRNPGGEAGSVAPRHLGDLVLSGHVCNSVDHLAGDLQHDPLGDGVNSAAEQVHSPNGQAGLLPGFPDRGGIAWLARLHFAGRELPRQLAFVDPPSDHQDHAVVDDDGRCDGPLVGLLLPPDEVKDFYPGVTAAAARDAVSFADYVDRAAGRSAA